MDITLVMIAAFIGVAALVGGIAYMFRVIEDSPVEDRLEVLTNMGTVAKKSAKRKEANLLAHALHRERTSLLETFVSRFLNFRKFLDQANIKIRPLHFVLISCVLVIAGGIGSIAGGLHPLVAPVIGLTAGRGAVRLVFFQAKKTICRFPEAAAGRAGVDRPSFAGRT